MLCLYNSAYSKGYGIFKTLKCNTPIISHIMIGKFTYNNLFNQLKLMSVGYSKSKLVLLQIVKASSTALGVINCFKQHYGNVPNSNIRFSPG